MNFVNNFIKRPVLTTVCTIVILLAGGLSIPQLPIAKLPQIAPSQISVAASYIGADAKTAEDNVTTVIERQINGVEAMKYMTSNTGNDGVTNISVYFPTEYNSDIAQVNVQNRVSQAQPNLPQAILQTGVTTLKASPNILLAISFYSEKGKNDNYLYDDKFLSNYVDMFIIDEVNRTSGVGQARIAGERKYAMRIWLDPNKLASRGLTAQDVINTIQEQNIQVGAGKIGQEPSPPDQKYEIALRSVGRFTTPAEAEDMVLKVGTDGTLIKIKDVGRAELGAEDYSTSAIFNGAPAVALLVYQLPGSNALDVANAVKEKLADLEKNFPPGMKAQVAFDTTLFVNASIEDVIVTLIEAILLVILVIFIFLQDWRTTIIPAIAVPVSLIGTMAFLLLFKFEINQLTTFALVLATGLVVDDGILVVEAISSKIFQGMTPMQAAIAAMEELTGAVIATSVVLMAVFIPVTFFPGTTGIVYKQFALTIVFSIAISAFNALTFSPSMSAILLRPEHEARGPLSRFFRLFNRGFDRLKAGYGGLLGFFNRIRFIIIAIFVAGLLTTGWIYQLVPQGFIPEEDQGYFLVIVQAPGGVSLKYTQNVLEQVSKEVSATPGIETSFGISGFGFTGNSSNQGLMFAKLKDWKERNKDSESVFGIMQQLNGVFRQKITDAQVIAVNAPPVDGLSNFGGVEFQLQNRGALPMDNLIANANKLMDAARKRPELGRVFTQFTPYVPQMSLSIDRNQAKAQNVRINDVFNTLQTYLGSDYVNQFVLGPRLYRVYAQAEGKFRSSPEDIGQLYVRSQDNKLVQLNNLVKVERFTYPPIITHYNVYQAIDIIASPAPGYSTGQAIQVMEELANQVLDPGFKGVWTGTALEQTSSGNSAVIIFGLAFVMIFLVLAAQYESYIDPMIILLTVPLAVLGALGTIWLRANVFMVGGIWPAVSNDIYCQVALVMLIGLASKNAILIVEFANEAHHKEGMSISKAAVHAAQQRLRPILMTAIAALVGFWPLVIASGAGAMSRWSLGTAIFGGLLLATIMSLLLVPTLYIVIKNLEISLLKGGKPKPPSSPTPPTPPTSSIVPEVSSTPEVTGVRNQQV
jgi:hydrophobe/amphiphile efflux-1 (HAE1) family protein